MISKFLVYGGILSLGVATLSFSPVTGGIAGGILLTKALEQGLGYCVNRLSDETSKVRVSPAKAKELLVNHDLRLMIAETLGLLVEQFANDPAFREDRKALRKLKKVLMDQFSEIQDSETDRLEGLSEQAILDEFSQGVARLSGEQVPDDEIIELLDSLMQKEKVTFSLDYVKVKLAQKILRHFFPLLLAVISEKMADGKQEGYKYLLYQILEIRSDLQEQSQYLQQLQELCQSHLTAIEGLHGVLFRISVHTDEKLDQILDLQVGFDARQKQMLQLLEESNAKLDQQTKLQISHPKPREASQTQTPSISDLNFRQQWLPFRPQPDVMNTLRGFVESEPQFSWWALIGNGGVGKSRTAQELCLYYMSLGWMAGIHRKGKTEWFGCSGAWEPTAPTLLIFDYAAHQASDIQSVLEEFADRSFNYPVRILLLDRLGSSQTWFLENSKDSDQITGNTQSALRKSLYSEREEKNPTAKITDQDFLTLTPPDQSEWVAYIRETLNILGKAELEAPDDVGFLNRLHHLTGGGRPLYLQIAAVVFAEKGNTIFESDHQDELLSEILSIELDRRWKDAVANTDLHEPLKRLLAITTLCRGVSFEYQDALFKLADIPEVKKLRNELEDALLKLYRSESGNEEYPGMTPDLLGEYFLLCGGSPGENRSHRKAFAVEDLVEYCLEKSPGNACETLRLLINDFPESTALDNIIRKVLAIIKKWKGSRDETSKLVGVTLFFRLISLSPEDIRLEQLMDTLNNLVIIDSAFSIGYLLYYLHLTQMDENKDSIMGMYNYIINLSMYCNTEDENNIRFKEFLSYIIIDIAKYIVSNMHWDALKIIDSHTKRLILYCNDKKEIIQNCALQLASISMGLATSKQWCHLESTYKSFVLIESNYFETPETKHNRAILIHNAALESGKYKLWHLLEVWSYRASTLHNKCKLQKKTSQLVLEILFNTISAYSESRLWHKVDFWMNRLEIYSSELKSSNSFAIIAKSLANAASHYHLQIISYDHNRFGKSLLNLFDKDESKWVIDVRRSYFRVICAFIKKQKNENIVYEIYRIYSEYPGAIRGEPYETIIQGYLIFSAPLTPQKTQNNIYSLISMCKTINKLLSEEFNDQLSYLWENRRHITNFGIMLLPSMIKAKMKDELTNALNDPWYSEEELEEIRDAISSIEQGSQPDNDT